jgi:hypothetical protein
VRVETGSLIAGDLRLLSFGQHRNLLDRLQRANLIIRCRLSLDTEGANLVDALQRQVLEYCQEHRFVFPPAPDSIQAEFGTSFISIHDLPFTLLELTSNHRGGQPSFRKTRVAEPLTLQILLGTLFSKRIMNTLHAQEKIPMLFIGMASSFSFVILF